MSVCTEMQVVVSSSNCILISTGHIRAIVTCFFHIESNNKWKLETPPKSYNQHHPFTCWALKVNKQANQ